jgi:hypothetical protein
MTTLSAATAAHTSQHGAGTQLSELCNSKQRCCDELGHQVSHLAAANKTSGQLGSNCASVVSGHTVGVATATTSSTNVKQSTRMEARYKYRYPVILKRLCAILTEHA